VRDYSLVKGDGNITFEDANNALLAMEIDAMGLDSIDIKMLKAMIELFGGRPVGLDTISASINEDSNTIEDVYEPYLIQLGFITRTPKGRIALPLAYKHLGYKNVPQQSDYLPLLDEIKDEEI
ncbi:MAG: Holliday junction DNA helicase RuvB C-terminal domain-containing protein, partial [Clostridia bacterium]